MKITYDYDDGADVLYITFGKPKDAICDEIADGVLLRKNKNTGRLVGITIIDFSSIADNS